MDLQNRGGVSIHLVVVLGEKGLQRHIDGDLDPLGIMEML